MSIELYKVVGRPADGMLGKRLGKQPTASRPYLWEAQNVGGDGVGLAGIASFAIFIAPWVFWLQMSGPIAKSFGGFLCFNIPEDTI